MSLASLLSIARTALTVHQRAMDVTAHNIANANTPGYSRQRIELTSATPLVLPTYSVGRGVESGQVSRTRDVFYDAAYRRDQGLFGRSNTMYEYLSQVETALNEPSDTGLSSSLDGLFRSLSDLANDPANHTNRELVVSAGQRLVQQFHSLDTQLGRMEQEAADNLRVQVDQVNSLSARIADLNSKVVASGGGHGSPDLMDQRDTLIDQLSQFMNVRVLTRPDGSVGVAAGDTVLVDGAQATSLAVASAGSGWGIVPAGGGAAIDPQGGSLGALVDLSQNRLPGVRAKLDQLAASLVTEFNAVHRTGYTLGGAVNVEFFDSTRTTAGSIQLSGALLSSSDNLAASATGADGNGAIAGALAALATTGVASLGGKTFRETFVTLAAGVGLDVSNAQQDVSAQGTLVERDDAARNAVSGVNTDEEMINLISQQQAYGAAARLVSVAQQMIDDLLQVI